MDVSFSTTIAFWLPLHMRVDVEKAAEQRLAGFQKCCAKSVCIYSNLWFSVPGRTSSPPNHWRLRTSKTERVYRNWNYHYLIGFCFFFFLSWKTRTLKHLVQIFCNTQVECSYEVASGQDWSSKNFWSFWCNMLIYAGTTIDVLGAILWWSIHAINTELLT